MTIAGELNRVDTDRVEWHFGDGNQSIQNKACTSAMVLGGVETIPSGKEKQLFKY